MEDSDAEATTASGGAKEEENPKARYLKNASLSKHSRESEYTSVAGQTSLGPREVGQSPLVSMPSGLSPGSPREAAVQFEDHRTLCLEGNASATCRT